MFFFNLSFLNTIHPEFQGGGPPGGYGPSGSGSYGGYNGYDEGYRASSISFVTTVFFLFAFLFVVGGALTGLRRIMGQATMGVLVPPSLACHLLPALDIMNNRLRSFISFVFLFPVSLIIFNFLPF